MANSLHASSVEAPISNTFTVYVNRVILGMHGDPLLFTNQILSTGLKKVGPKRAKNLPLIWQERSTWQAEDSSGATVIYSSTKEKNTTAFSLAPTEASGKKLCKEPGPAFSIVSFFWTSGDLYFHVMLLP